MEGLERKRRASSVPAVIPPKPEGSFIEPLRLVRPSSTGRILLEGRCVCGQTWIGSLTNWRTGNTKSCGCQAPNHRGQKLYNNLRQAGARIGKCHIGRSPEQRQYLDSIFDGKCAYTGEPIGFKDMDRRKGNYKSSAHIDHIDPTSRELKDNAAWVHWAVNMMKSDLSYDELLDWAKKLVAYEETARHNIARLTKPDKT